MIRDYQLMQVLGRGSFGIVYIAKYKYWDETIAIKEFLPTDLAFRKDATLVAPISAKTEREEKTTVACSSK
jgi:hypothetical protein